MKPNSRIRRLWIANQGEIVGRVARSARALGVESVCPVAAGDAVPAHVRRWVDEVVAVTPFDRTLFLDATHMIALALQTRCDAVHPGYGFLAESAAFATQVIAAGLVWVGPPPEAMGIMADKVTARALVQRLGVPCLPGIACEGLPPKTVSEFGDTVGFPILVKAAAGGGGKGIRLVSQRADVAEALEQARSEARASFGDGRLLVEKAILKARHVEVQVVVDGDGDVVLLGSRDCSLQRRNQKLIEEAPAPALPPRLEAALLRDSATLCRSINYRSLGTVEWLVDVASLDDEEPRAYFLEMNTRLQVEHPVSEELYGVDLVAAQLQIAAGEPVAARLRAATPRGHTLEARICAESPQRDLMPVAGPCAGVVVHPDDASLRWELGVEDTATLRPDFDSMLGKLVVWAPTREEARQRLVLALSRTVLGCRDHNLGYLAELLESMPFRCQTHTTRTVTELHQDVVARLKRAEAVLARRVAPLWTRAQLWRRAAGVAGSRAGPGPPCPTWWSDWARAELEAWQQEITEWRGQGQTVIATHRDLGRVLLQLDHGDGLRLWLAGAGGHLQLETLRRQTGGTGAAGAAGTASGDDVRATVPGRVVQLRVAAGDAVTAAQPVVVLESMKIELALDAPRAGRVAAIDVAVGALVREGQRLLTLDRERS